MILPSMQYILAHYIRYPVLASLMVTTKPHFRSLEELLVTVELFAGFLKVHDEHITEKTILFVLFLMSFVLYCYLW